MKSQEICPDVEELLKWRRQLYNALGSRRETVMELLDSLSSNRQASTVAELSLNPLFRRDYNSLYKGIQEFLPSPTNDNYQKAVDSLLSVVSATIPPPVSRQFYLFGVDVTPCPRPYSATLEDKKYIYQPNTIKGNKPINIGHAYSVIAALPERSETGNVPWAIPLSGQRVSSGEKDISVASNQVKKILNHSSVPWKDKLSVLVADSLYSQRGFLGEQVKQNNLVTLTRGRSNRVFYRQFIPEDYSPKQPGHPRWYGDKFDLKDETTWLEPDEIIQSTFTTKRGRELNLKISGWKQMLMRGTSDYEMHSHPFTLLQIIVSDETGKAVWKPMWLILIGSRRYELSLQECYEAYGQRYDLEHLFRFGQQKLLLNAYYTPEVNHEENWVQLTLLAAVNLWATRKLALVLGSISLTR
ncbi:hypothetical protein myaer102_16170 [Microcystis viridis NIES-102]|uniref:Transposase IS701-like DDE domain-containing protein n=1 Tax=Microcystis viridis NIES-102 TaxID=213615 RepID=A0A3G9JGM3_MICVR|nr:NF041680 family putative transposase [Microcystis viridis]BBH39092.1 hypothetical protein myaer102_16170 [Microcystis viridis NIES-102]